MIKKIREDYWESDSKEDLCENCLRRDNASQYSRCPITNFLKGLTEKLNEEDKLSITKCGVRDGLTGTLLYVPREK
jgi:hypothetical protein